MAPTPYDVSHTALAAESIAALLLHRLAITMHTHQQHTPSPRTVLALFLFNPLQLCAVMSGAVGGQIVTAAVLGVLVCAGSSRGHHGTRQVKAWATGVALALAVYVFPYSVTLLVGGGGCCCGMVHVPIPT